MALNPSSTGTAVVHRSPSRASALPLPGRRSSRDPSPDRPRPAEQVHRLPERPRSAVPTLHGGHGAPAAAPPRPTSARPSAARGRRRIRRPGPCLLAGVQGAVSPRSDRRAGGGVGGGRARGARRAGGRPTAVAGARAVDARGGAAEGWSARRAAGGRGCRGAPSCRPGRPGQPGPADRRPRSGRDVDDGRPAGTGLGRQVRRRPSELGPAARRQHVRPSRRSRDHRQHPRGGRSRTSGRGRRGDRGRGRRRDSTQTHSARLHARRVIACAEGIGRRKPVSPGSERHGDRGE